MDERPTSSVKSTFFFKTNLKRDAETLVEADYVTFESGGWVVFHESEILDFLNHQVVRPGRIIKAVHREDCHDLREVINDGSE